MTTKNILLYIWQLPQNLLGLALRAYFRRKSESYDEFYLNDAILSVASGMKGGISLGKYIIVRRYDDDTINHEYGHCRQSKRWGPLYLFVPGLASLTHNIFCNCEKHKHGSYYNIWPENKADRLGGVERK